LRAEWLSTKPRNWSYPNGRRIRDTSQTNHLEQPSSTFDDLPDAGRRREESCCLNASPSAGQGSCVVLLQSRPAPTFCIICNRLNWEWPYKQTPICLEWGHFLTLC
jgi:hypothetical protein